MSEVCLPDWSLGRESQISDSASLFSSIVAVTGRLYSSTGLLSPFLLRGFELQLLLFSALEFITVPSLPSFFDENFDTAFLFSNLPSSGVSTV